MCCFLCTCHGYVDHFNVILTKVRFLCSGHWFHESVGYKLINFLTMSYLICLMQKEEVKVVSWNFYSIIMWGCFGHIMRNQNCPKYGILLCKVYRYILSVQNFTKPLLKSAIFILYPVSWGWYLMTIVASKNSPPLYFQS